MKTKANKKAQTAREFQKELGRWYRLNYAVIDKSPNAIVAMIGLMLEAESRSKQVVRGEGSGSMGLREIRLTEAREESLAGIMLRAMMYAEFHETFISYHEAETYWELTSEYGEAYHLSHLFETLAIMYDNKNSRSYTEGEDLARVWAQRVLNCAYALMREYKIDEVPFRAMRKQWCRLKVEGPVFKG